MSCADAAGGIAIGRDYDHGKVEREKGRLMSSRVIVIGNHDLWLYIRDGKRRLESASFTGVLVNAVYVYNGS